MSEANVPPSAANYDYTPDDMARADGATPTSPTASSAQAWEAVPVPGTLPAEAIAPSPQTREIELLELIQDLNRCNEVLLARVNHLEEALEVSQQALQQEVERSQQVTEADRVAIARQQSVAQLLSELEESNTALKRQSILAETLQAQLETYQERSKQLERECAVLRKQNTEKGQQVQELDSTCRDLRSRLQRQQRYTLQFKAALEKCLDVSHHKTGQNSEVRPDADLYDASSAPDIGPLAMPRADRIQPWSAQEMGPQTDAQLLSLVRSLREPEPVIAAPPPPAVAPAATNTDSLAIDQEAEQQLWQDVERVLDNSTQTPTPAAPLTTEGIPTATSDEADTPFTEPMPWGPVRSPAVDQAESAPIAFETEPEAMPVWETSPLTTVEADPQPDLAPSASPVPAPELEIPAMQATQTAQPSPSPIVHPLRPTKKKRTSLSAVELPSFPPLPKTPAQGR